MTMPLGAPSSCGAHTATLVVHAGSSQSAVPLQSSSTPLKQSSTAAHIPLPLDAGLAIDDALDVASATLAPEPPPTPPPPSPPTFSYVRVTGEQARPITARSAKELSRKRGATSMA